jgi:DNA-binding beta-propeller fold protein YncE
MKLKTLLLICVFPAIAAQGQGTLYVSFSDSSIRTLDAEGRSSAFAPPGIYPYTLAVGWGGNLFASDGLDEIYRFDSAGRAVLFANTGVMSGPTGMAFGPDGYLYVANYRNSTIYRYDQEGRRSAFVGSGQQGVHVPRSLAIDSEGYVYVVGSSDNTIRRFDSSGNSSIFYSGEIRAPWSMAFDPNGNLFLATLNGEILRFDPQGQRTLFARTPDSPLHIATDGAGNVYATFSHLEAVLRFDPQGNSTTFFNTSPHGNALGIAFIPEPSGLALLLLGGWAFMLTRFWDARRVRQASNP